MNEASEIMKTNDINGKRILFFSPAFFKYEKIIADKMREMGADVDMYDVRSVTSAWNRALLKVCPGVFKKQSQQYYERIIEQNKKKDYDYILIVKCDMTPENILVKLRESFPHAKLCLNLWDSVKNIPGILKKLKYFDTLHSFDPADCKAIPELKFRPLFFCDHFRRELQDNKEYLYDISFLGTIHSDRFFVIKQVQAICKQNALRCFWFLYLQSNFIYFFYWLIKKEFRGVKKKTFSFQKMSAKDVANIVDKSRIILDIQHPNQIGLTMRTIEMIGMNKKLITTNQSIKEYDFFNPDNILVVDRNKVEIPTAFLNTQYIPVPEHIYENYSLKNWILEVLS